jgi:peptide-methionine (R)-S-oxide reductase
MDEDRRLVVKLAIAGASLLAVCKFSLMEHAMAAEEKITKIEKTDAEWKAELPAESYDVLRHEGTERAFTSPLNDEKHAGTFVCAGCGLPLFPSKFKYNSGTGWPSFFDVIPGHIEEKTDYKIIAPRTEYHCARCGGHQGHVFNDGPQPTGLRYCNNGVALKFIPDKA